MKMRFSQLLWLCFRIFQSKKKVVRISQKICCFSFMHETAVVLLVFVDATTDMLDKAFSTFTRRFCAYPRSSLGGRSNVFLDAKKQGLYLVSLATI